MKTILSLKPVNVHVGVRLTLGKKSIKVDRAVLDTGATASVIDRSLARRLGMKLRTVGYGRQVRGKLTLYRGALDKLEIISESGRPMCSVGPVGIDVIDFGTGGTMLIGSDLLKHFKVQLGFRSREIIMRCNDPGSLLGALVLGRATGAW